MTAISHDDLGKNIRSLPPLPVIVIDLLNSFEQQDVNLGELAKKVSRDQALAAKTLRLANSSFYGLSRKVATIQQAITVLGFDSVRALITAAAATDVFSSSIHPAFEFKSFWQLAAGTAVCSKLLARGESQSELRLHHRPIARRRHAGAGDALSRAIFGGSGIPHPA
jgi:HD-like signal output (HDOD) protein